jgi:hypothetical protein
MTLTVHELIELLEELIELIRKARQSPPAAVKDLHGAVNRSNNMATATLTWTNPTTRVDGSPLAASDIARVEAFDGDTSFGFVTSPFTTPTLTVGDHSFTVVITDNAGHVSAPSNNALITIPPSAANPSPVTDLAATLNP